MKFIKLYFIAAVAMTAVAAAAMGLKEPGVTVIPAVKSSTALPGTFNIPAEFRVKAPAKCEMALEMLGEALAGRNSKLVPDANKADCVFDLVTTGEYRSPEAYTIIISPEGIRISAGSDRGLFYGAQTLIPMIRAAKDNKLACCRIDDFPDLAVRGMQYTMRYVCRRNLKYFKSWVRALASLKYNTLLLEFVDNFPYKNNPFTLRKESLTRAEMEELRDWIYAHKMTIIPQVQLITHVRSLDTHPRFNEFLEAPTKMKSRHDAAYCPSNEEVNDLIKMIISEQLEFFKPEYFDLCYDEFDLVPFRVCPKCKARKTDEILLSQLKMASDLIYAAGAKVQIYHDCFLPGRVCYDENLLPRLDRRISFTYWSYVENPAPLHKNFKKLGFPVVTMPLVADPINTRSMVRYAKQENLRGSILTYWYHWWHRGHDIRPRTAAGYGGQVACAELCWNPDNDRELIPTDTVQEMRFRLGMTGKETAGSWKSIPLDDAVNAELGSNTSYPVFTDSAKLQSVKKNIAANPEKFDLITRGNSYYGVLLAGSPSDPNKRMGKLIGIDAKVKEFAFLMTTSTPNNIKHFQVRGKFDVASTPEIGSITFNYEDKTSHTAKLFYRKNITDWANEFSGTGMRHAHRDTDSRSAIFSFGATRIVNPHPEKKVDTIIFSSVRYQGIAPLLLAVSAITDRDFAPKKIVDSRITVKGKTQEIKRTSLFNAETDSPAKANVRLITQDKRAKDGFFFPNKLLKSEIAYDVNGAKVLRFTVPAKPEKENLQRVIIQIPVKNVDPANKSISWEFRAGTPSLHRYYGIFFGAPQKKDFPRITFFDHSSMPDQTFSSEVSFADMRQEGLKSPAEAEDVWISFWLVNDKPITIDLYHVSVSTSVGKVMPNLRHSSAL